MSARPFDVPERAATPSEPDTNDPKLDALLTIADDAQALFPGSFIELVVHIPAEDHLWRDHAEITDQHKLYSVKLARRVA